MTHFGNGKRLFCIAKLDGLKCFEIIYILVWKAWGLNCKKYDSLRTKNL